MLDKHHDIIKSLIGSSFIVIISTFVYIAAYYYERSYLIALDVPKEYAVTISEVRLITYISLLAAFASIGSILALLFLGLAKVTRLAEVFKSTVKNKSKGIFLKRSDRSLFANAVLVLLSLYLLLAIFTLMASALGSISAEIGKPLPKIRYQDRTYDLVREYGNRIILSENNTQNDTKTVRVEYTSSIGSFEITE
jgi:hypothetical protein